MISLRQRVLESRARRARLTQLTEQAVHKLNASSAVTVRAAERVEAAAVALVNDHEKAMDDIAASR